MNKSILIKNAFVISGSDIKESDVFIVDGKISVTGLNLNIKAQTEIEARGLYLIPGVIDSHVHFREPGMEWKENIETGSKAAASGGVTSFFDMPNNDPATVDVNTIREKKLIASKKSLVNYNFYIGATKDNLSEINSIKNIPGIKIFMGSSTGNLLISEYSDLEKIFETGNRLLVIHAEDEEIIRKNRENFNEHGKIRSVEAALNAVKKSVELSRKYERRIHILHISSREEICFFKENRGLVSLEVCPHHLLLDSSFRVNPPIRGGEHSMALWNGLKSGIIDTVASDHAPHTVSEKGKFSGVPGVETILPIMLNRVNAGFCSLNDVVKWMCENPVRIFGIKNKGYVKEGYDADLVLVDMKKKKKVENGKLHTMVNWSPYHGQTLSGWPLVTIVNGNIVFREGDFFTNVKGKEIIINENNY